MYDSSDREDEGGVHAFDLNMNIVFDSGLETRFLIMSLVWKHVSIDLARLYIEIMSIVWKHVSIDLSRICFIYFIEWVVLLFTLVI